jgi:hypothetical protein
MRDPQHLITLWASTACYEDSFTFYVLMIFIPHKHTYRPQRHFKGMAFLFYEYMIFVPHRKRAYTPPGPFTGIALFHDMYMMFVAHRKHI